jgi:hypothetical protein
MTPIAALNHPSWCSSDHCDAGHRDAQDGDPSSGATVLHRGTGVVWRTAHDAEISVRRSQFDDGSDAFPVVVELRVRDLAYPDEVTVSLDMNDVTLLLAAVGQLRNL